MARHPFCTLLHFKKENVEHPGRASWWWRRFRAISPRCCGERSRRCSSDHDVYITDWTNARKVPMLYGRFDLDDHIDLMIAFMRELAPDLHVIAVCQPSVPVLAAVALMAAEHDPGQPQTMTLMGGPIDTRVNPTAVNRLATTRSLDWFERNVIATVPARYPGAFRRVYPGFLQLAGFMTMNLDRHVTAHVDLFRHLVRGDGESAERDQEILRRIHVGDGFVGRFLSADGEARVPGSFPAAGPLRLARAEGRAQARSRAPRS